MIVSTRPFRLFDYFRVPYRLEPDAEPFGRLGNEHGAIVWPVGSSGGEGRRELWRLGDCMLYATLADEATMLAQARELGGSWEELGVLHDADHVRAGSIRRNDSRVLLLPFDPGDSMVSLWSEAYARERPRRRLGAALLRGYYLARPLVPRRGQLALRRGFSRVQARSSFPRWPIETSLHDLYELLFDWIAVTLGDSLPAIGSWPNGKRWCLVLTHDVEHESGYRSLGELRDLELTHDCRSAWYFVPERDYTVSDGTVAALHGAGFEVGVHGLRHDGRDLVPSVLSQRLGAIHTWRKRWGAVGFRAPALHRDWELMPTLGFDYDTSSFDTDPYEPQGGGCCTWLPFENQGLVELPLTVTMDHTVFEILDEGSAIWFAKADALRARGGLTMLLTHPDYMSASGRLDAYDRFLDRYAADETVWHALPREVSAWWRRRAASTIEELEDGSLEIAGPAGSEAQIVRLGRPSG